MGRNSLLNFSASTSCASSTSSSTSAVAPTTLAEGSALRKSCRQFITRRMWPASAVQWPRSPASSSRSRSRRMLICAWGTKVGAAFTRLPPETILRVISRTSSQAESSFLPPCRAISTVKSRPRRWNTLSRIALAASDW